MNVQQERTEKLARLRRLMADSGVDAIWLRRMSSFAWLTAGAASHVSFADEHGIASLLVTADEVHLVVNNIEAPRLMAEEGLSPDDYQWHIFPWHEPADPAALMPDGSAIGCDEAYPGTIDLGSQVSRLRSRLLPPEIECMRDVGRRCAESVQETLMRVRPGLTELEIAGILAREAFQRGVAAIVNLIAADERIYQFRHPIPTPKKLDRYAMVVLSGRRHGLIASVTRLVHFGPLPDDLRAKMGAVATVDAAFISHTRPGARLRDIFQAGADAYAAAGYRDEWLHHHQGGTSGYEGREEKGTPRATGIVHVGQAYAWNPSIAGVKSEDTIIVGENTNEVITLTPELPTVALAVDDTLVLRPAIWERT